MIWVYADWEQGYMGDAFLTEQKDFKTMDEAEATIKNGENPQVM